MEELCFVNTPILSNLFECLLAEYTGLGLISNRTSCPPRKNGTGTNLSVTLVMACTGSSSADRLGWHSPKMAAEQFKVIIEFAKSKSNTTKKLKTNLLKL